MTIKTKEGKITCDKDMMNYLSIIFGEAAERYKSLGLYGLAKQASENSNLIYNALNDCHYYD